MINRLEPGSMLMIEEKKNKAGDQQYIFGAWFWRFWHQSDDGTWDRGEWLWSNIQTAIGSNQKIWLQVQVLNKEGSQAHRNQGKKYHLILLHAKIRVGTRRTYCQSKITKPL